MRRRFKEPLEFSDDKFIFVSESSLRIILVIPSVLLIWMILVLLSLDMIDDVGVLELFLATLITLAFLIGLLSLGILRSLI